ncbi:MAG: DUF6065 family protein [Litorimonas sp.]
MDPKKQLFLDAYKIHESGAPPLVPGRARRDWMDSFVDRHPYRCLPLTMANSTGWELTCPFAIDVTWNGGPNEGDLTVSSPDRPEAVASLASSHFRKGIVTFHTGYLFRTPPGWAVMCGGPPNWPKDGVYPLSGLVESDWLPFPFTMNWQMTRPGTVRFEKDEPFCFITLSEHHRLEAIEPKIKSFSSNKVLKRDYDNWNKSRDSFNTKLALLDPEVVSKGWQRHYMKGEAPSGNKPSDTHLTKRRLKPPKDVTGAALLTPKPK